MLITFSGLDGSGKSTLIEVAKAHLQSKGCRVVVLTMYDNISFYSFLRGMLGSLKKMLSGCVQTAPSVPVEPDSGLGQPATDVEDLHDPKIAVDDKKSILSKFVYRCVRSIFARRAALFLDLMVLLGYRIYIEGCKKGVLITDRYIYDTLADVSDLKSKRWSFVRVFLLITPRPDVPVFVDVLAQTAFDRKKEYPVAYMEWRRAAYQKIFGWVRDPLVIFNDDLLRSCKTLRDVLDNE